MVSDDPSGELNFNELVHQRPHWQIDTFKAEQRRKKKIVISDWRFAYNFSLLEIESHFIAMLINAGFVVYYWQKELQQKGLHEKYRSRDKKWSQHIDPGAEYCPASRSEVYAALGQCNEDLRKILVLDHAGFQEIAKIIAKQLEIVPAQVYASIDCPFSC